MSTAEQIDAIDLNNQVVGVVTKGEAYANAISHRIVHVMVSDGNKFFVPRRSLNVRYLPGHFCTSAGGHVQSGESAEQGALRELKEEIGLNGPIEFVAEYFFTHDFPVHTSVFIKKYDPKIDRLELNPEEVLSGNFLSLDEIAKLDVTQMHPQLIACLEYLRGPR